MKKYWIIVGYIGILMLLLAGCSKEEAESGAESQNAVTAESVTEMFSKEDKEVGYDETNSISITLSENGITSSDQGTLIEENVVTISEAGTYILTGELSKGQVMVDADEKDTIQIVLKDVTLSNDSSAAIYVKQANKVILTLAEGSTNSLSVTDEFVAIDDNSIDAVVFSKDNITLNGDGLLSITSKTGNAITSKGDLIVTSGNYKIDAKNHGIEGKDSVRIANGEFEITSENDGIHSENKEDTSLGFVYIAEGTFNIVSTTDAIDGSAYISIENGSFDLTTNGGSENAAEKTNNDRSFSFDGGSRGDMPEKEMPNGEMPDREKPDGEMPDRELPNEEIEGQKMSNEQMEIKTQEETGTQQEDETASAKGLKSDGTITIQNGSFTINSSDDAIHANEDILIKDGVFELSSGDDGIHADANLTIDGGEISITDSYEGLEGQGVEISGGTITLSSSDDGMNASGENSFIKISGGKITIGADGDGIDSNGTISVSGGETYISGPVNNANAAFDYDGTADISGGILIAVGSSGMAQNFNGTSKQGSILISTESVQSDSVLLKDSNGKELIKYQPDKEYSSVLISTPDIVEGETYMIVMGEETQTVEMTSLIYGSSQGLEGMGGKKTRFGDVSKSN